jgi:N-acetylneuraminate synthase
LNNVKIIAEIGINHNGDLDLAKKLIDIASVAGCNYVKFQKRNPDICVPESQKNKLKKVPWRKEEITYLQYKKDIEFSLEQYEDLFHYCEQRDIKMFASVWDRDSVDFMRRFTSIVKIPSALITDLDLLLYTSEVFKHGFKILSTGMSTEEQIKKAIDTFSPSVVMHTNSTYPTPVEELNLGYIVHLKRVFPECEIGYSNHAYGIVPMFAAVALGARMIEFHITLNHSLWGSDQSSSIEPNGVLKLVKGIRDLESSLLGDEDRIISSGEKLKLKTLRKK